MKRKIRFISTLFLFKVSIISRFHTLVRLITYSLQAIMPCAVKLNVKYSHLHWIYPTLCDIINIRERSIILHINSNSYYAGVTNHGLDA